MQSGEFFRRLTGALSKVGLPLIKYFLMSLGLTAAAPATDVAIQKKNSWIREASFRISTVNNTNNFK